MGRQFNEDNLTAEVVKRLGKTRDKRFREIMISAVKHLHAFARDVKLTEEEWFEGIKFLTQVGQKCDDKRQEFILLSDILGLSMMIVALNHKTAPGATRSGWSSPRASTTRSCARPRSWSTRGSPARSSSPGAR